MKPKLFEGFGEGARVRVVAVDERAVDVEDDALEFQTAASGERGSKSFQPLRHTPSARPRSRAPYSRSTFTALASLPARSTFTAIMRPPLGSDGVSMLTSLGRGWCTWRAVPMKEPT